MIINISLHTEPTETNELFLKTRKIDLSKLLTLISIYCIIEMIIFALKNGFKKVKSGTLHKINIPWVRRLMSSSSPNTSRAGSGFVRQPSVGTPIMDNTPEINVIVDLEKRARLESEVNRIRRSIVDQNAGISLVLIYFFIIDKFYIDNQYPFFIK